MPTLSLASVVVKSPVQVSTSLGAETVILGLAAEEYYSLQEAGARIWEIIEEPSTVRQVLETLLREYAVEPERCERDLLAVLQDMADEGLVEVR